MEKERPKVKEKIRIMLYERASKVDLSCYDDPEFYNSQVWITRLIRLKVL